MSYSISYQKFTAAQKIPGLSPAISQFKVHRVQTCVLLESGIGSPDSKGREDSLSAIGTAADLMTLPHQLFLLMSLLLIIHCKLFFTVKQNMTTVLFSLSFKYNYFIFKCVCVYIYIHT